MKLRFKLPVAILASLSVLAAGAPAQDQDTKVDAGEKKVEKKKINKKKDPESIGDRDVMVLSDEIYGRITYDGTPTSIASMDGMLEKPER